MIGEFIVVNIESTKILIKDFPDMNRKEVSVFLITMKKIRSEPSGDSYLYPLNQYFFISPRFFLNSS